MGVEIGAIKAMLQELQSPCIVLDHPEGVKKIK